MTKQEARLNLDEAWCLYFEALGIPRADADYSPINELIDDIEAQLKSAA